jgi:hypothetical protein
MTFTRDPQETAARNFKDKKSYVALDGREILYGRDREDRYIEVIKRDKGICQHCHNRVEYWQGYDVHHVKHRRNKQQHDDRMENLILVHRNCHNLLHIEKSVRFTRGKNLARRKKDAARDFFKMMGEEPTSNGSDTK